MLEKPGWPLPRGGHFVGYAVGQILSWDTRTMIWAAEEHRLLAVLQRIVRDHAIIGLLNRSSVTQFAQEVAVLLLLELEPEVLDNVKLEMAEQVGPDDIIDIPTLRQVITATSLYETISLLDNGHGLLGPGPVYPAQLANCPAVRASEPVRTSGSSPYTEPVASVPENHPSPLPAAPETRSVRRDPRSFPPTLDGDEIPYNGPVPLAAIQAEVARREEALRRELKGPVPNGATAHESANRGDSINNRPVDAHHASPRHHNGPPVVDEGTSGFVHTPAETAVNSGSDAATTVAADPFEHGYDSPPIYQEHENAANARYGRVRCGCDQHGDVQWGYPRYDGADDRRPLEPWCLQDYRRAVETIRKQRPTNHITYQDTNILSRNYLSSGAQMALGTIKRAEIFRVYYQVMAADPVPDEPEDKPADDGAPDDSIDNHETVCAEEEKGDKEDQSAAKEDQSADKDNTPNETHGAVESGGPMRTAAIQGSIFGPFAGPPAPGVAGPLTPPTSPADATTGGPVRPTVVYEASALERQANPGRSYRSWVEMRTAQDDPFLRQFGGPARVSHHRRPALAAASPAAGHPAAGTVAPTEGPVSSAAPVMALAPGHSALTAPSPPGTSAGQTDDVAGDSSSGITGAPARDAPAPGGSMTLPIRKWKW